MTNYTMNNITVGITEISDAGIDLHWKNKTKENAYNVLITKNLTDGFIQAVADSKDNIIVHATITGMGGSIIEPNVPTTEWSVAQLHKLCSVFPSDRVVLRIDPIIPTEKGLKTASKPITEMLKYPVDEMPSRIRVSVLDMYPHVKARFKAAGIPLPYDTFQAPKALIKDMNFWLQKVRQTPIIEGIAAKMYDIEACAEPLLKAEQLGCINQKDADIFGIKLPNTQSNQRKTCLCCGCKKQLLTMPKNHPCSHGCLYCYWKNESERIELA